MKEAKLIKIKAELVPVYEDKLTRQQRKSTKRCTMELYQLWTEYEENTRSARSLLEAGCRLVCPNIDVV